MHIDDWAIPFGTGASKSKQVGHPWALGYALALEKQLLYLPIRYRVDLK